MKEKLIQFLSASKTQLFLYPVLAGICLPLGFERYKIFPILFLLPLFFHGMRQLPLKKKIIAYWLFAIVTNFVGYNWIRGVAEDFGGDVQMVPVSALKKTNLDALEEAVMLQAELLELKANPDRSADGIVVEAELDKGRGPVATVLVQRGTLRKGDIFVSGAEYGRVRSLINSHGEVIETAGPSIPV